MYSNELICNILKYINQNINKEITGDELSIKFFFNKTYILKKFKKELNLTIREYINNMRILNSLSYFKYDKTILFIALNNGFNSIEYFSETFKKIIGVNPRIYKNYVNYKKYTSKKNEKLIFQNISYLLSVKSKIESYLLHQKTNISRKVLIKEKLS